MDLHHQHLESSEEVSFVLRLIPTPPVRRHRIITEDAGTSASGWDVIIETPERSQRQTVHGRPISSASSSSDYQHVQHDYVNIHAANYGYNYNQYGYIPHLPPHAPMSPTRRRRPLPEPSAPPSEDEDAAQPEKTARVDIAALCGTKMVIF